MSDVFDLPGVDDLFDGELADFVARRDALVKQLKADGDKTGAAAVKSLRKPSAVAWAVNEVARHGQREVSALIEAGRDVRSAQARALQGKDDGGLRSSTRVWREQVHALADQAAAAVGAQYRDDAAAAFEAASVDDELAVVLTAGRFLVAPAPSGFGLAGMPEPVERVAKPRQETEQEKSDAPARDTRAVERARAELDEREQAVEKHLNRLRRAEQRLDHAREAVDTARAAHEDAEVARDAAAAALSALEAKENQAP